MKPINEQEQWFWEQCGFTVGEYADEWVSLDCTCFDGLPPIDLNNLFKYAVPKIGQNWTVTMNYSDGWYEFFIFNETADYLESSEDPALALFWAIYKALGLT